VISFGPELVGRTEKTLVALLRRNLAGTGLDEQQYVTLKVASTLAPSEDLAEAVRGRAHFADAAQIVTALTNSGLLNDGRLTPAGATLLEKILAESARQSTAIWTDMPEHDVAATTRVLNTVLTRAEAVLTHQHSESTARTQSRPTRRRRDILACTAALLVQYPATS
jgi:hypothetical protein